MPSSGFADTPAGQVEQLCRVRSIAQPPIGDDWPAATWEAVAGGGLTSWNIPSEYGGLGADSAAVLSGNLELARQNLGLALILSQFQAAVSRILSGTQESPKGLWLPPLAQGELLATVGLSHLTTSRQYADRPALVATVDGSGYRLQGETPWVTSATAADLLVVGAVDADGLQRLFAVETNQPGIQSAEPYRLMALTETCTARVRFENVAVPGENLLAGPVAQVLSVNGGSGAGSLTTSSLALGHAYAAVDQLQKEPSPSVELQQIVTQLQTEADELRQFLLAAARGTGSADWNPETLRAASTSLALRSCQSLVAASRGAGYVRGHPAERLLRESLFFLVWSCPQGVVTRMLQEFTRCDRGPE